MAGSDPFMTCVMIVIILCPSQLILFKAYHSPGFFHDIASVVPKEYLG